MNVDTSISTVGTSPATSLGRATCSKSYDSLRSSVGSGVVYLSETSGYVSISGPLLVCHAKSVSYRLLCARKERVQLCLAAIPNGALSSRFTCHEYHMKTLSPVVHTNAICYPSGVVVGVEELAYQEISSARLYSRLACYRFLIS